jgi:hypothetical protein
MTNQHMSNHVIYGKSYYALPHSTDLEMKAKGTLPMPLATALLSVRRQKKQAEN